MKQLTILTLIILAALSLRAQAFAGVVTGRVIVAGNTKSTIPNATISLLSAKDSAEVSVTGADTTGVFTFLNIKEGRYFVSVSAVGF